jgi:predicted  nucleic acid-binding Zn-ribbon protein
MEKISTLKRTENMGEVTTYQSNRKQLTGCRTAGHRKLSYVYEAKGQTEVARKAADPKAKVNTSEYWDGFVAPCVGSTRPYEPLLRASR